MNYIKILEKFISQTRIDHSIRVQQVAIQLAKHYEADVDLISRAAILHDIAKEQTPESLTTHNIDASHYDDIWKRYPATWHAFVGPLLIASECEVPMDTINDLVAHHTTGKANMSLETAIIFVADFIEPGRKAVIHKQIFPLAFQNLELAIAKIAENTLQKLKLKKLAIHPLSIECYNYYTNEKV
ncbi:MAG: bis(5'-nucleosyl)-tetraphosphatase (symmetrical) YqeK [Candidatus Marinamargulisbacteria bacterium]